MKENIAVYPGSFDPVTNGHLDIIKRVSYLYDKLIVAVVININKKTFLPSPVRVDLIRKAIADLENSSKIEVCGFEGLLVNFVKFKKAKVVIRGLRAVSDFEYEFQMALMNKKLYPQFETMFIASSEKFAYLSSNIVKEIHSFDGKIDCLVPAVVSEFLKNNLNTQ